MKNVALFSSLFVFVLGCSPKLNRNSDISPAVNQEEIQNPEPTPSASPPGGGAPSGGTTFGGGTPGGSNSGGTSGSGSSRCEQFVASTGKIYFLSPSEGSLSNSGLSPTTAWPDLQAVLSSNALMSKLTPGDVLCLRDGNHSPSNSPADVQVYNRSFSAPGISVVAETRHQAKINKLVVKSSSGIHINGLSISPSFCGHCITPITAADGIVLGENSSRIILRDNHVMTELMSVVSATWVENDWRYKRGNGILFKGTNSEISLIGNRIDVTNAAISMNGAVNSTLELSQNTVDHFGPGDAIHLGGLSHMEVHQNIVKNAIRYPDDGAHADLLQIREQVPSARITRNQLYQWTPEHLFPALKGNVQGIFGGQACSPCILESNLVANDHSHGITIAVDVADTKIVNNTVINIGDEVSGLALITTSGPGNVVANNLVTSLSLPPEVLSANNRILTRTDWESVFVNALAMDFRLRAGSTALDAGLAQFLSPDALRDAAGLTRVLGIEVDQGAFEYAR